MYVSSKSETHPQLNFKEYVVLFLCQQYKNVLFKIKS